MECQAILPEGLMKQWHQRWTVSGGRFTLIYPSLAASLLFAFVCLLDAFLYFSVWVGASVLILV